MDAAAKADGAIASPLPSEPVVHLVPDQPPSTNSCNEDEDEDESEEPSQLRDGENDEAEVATSRNTSAQSPSSPSPSPHGQDNNKIPETGKKESTGPDSVVGSNKLEDQINLQHLVELMKIFYEADENGSDGLDIDEFKAAFGQILGKGKKDQQMAAMFMKIDTNCDGTVDWNEICTFMLLEYQEKDMMEGEKLPLYPFPLKVLPSSHRDNITKIVELPVMNRPGNQGKLEAQSDGRFLSVCKDGTICFWRSNYTVQRIVQVESARSRYTWVTDLVVMANNNKIMVSFTDNTLAVYDIMTFDLQKQVVGLRNCAMAMHYWFDSKSPDHAVLVFGDSGGGVGIFEFTAATFSLFPSTSTSRNKDIPIAAFAELVLHPPKKTITTYLPGIHGDWVTEVLYCPYLEMCMSCSNDTGCSLHLVDSQGKKDGIVFSVRKGITSFDYSRDLNVIATGGLDRTLRLWNPYIPSKPTIELKGHLGSIVNVVLYSKFGEVLSFSRDLELRIWSVQDHTCLQVCHRFQELLPQPPTAFCLHPRTGALLIGTNQLGLLEPCRDDEIKTTADMIGRRSGKILSHERPLTTALYNSQFNQVVSGCQGGVVSVWDLDTGEKTMQFSHCHGNMELTAMTFDPSGRRLITGGRDGSLKIWNFNNGACLNVLQSKFTQEVTSLCFLKQKIIVGGWNKVLSVYSDTRDSEGSIPKCFGSGEHKEDILSVAGQEPNLLASASYDGDVLLWNIDSERCVGRLNAARPDARKPRPVFGCTGKRHSGVAHMLHGIHGVTEKRQHIFQRDKDEVAVEKLIFLKYREPSPTVGSLVACGAAGWIQFWNTTGGGLVGEYNVWETKRHGIMESERRLHSVTSMNINETETVLFTGNSLGYLQLWDISNYCLHKDCEETLTAVDKTPPPLRHTWRAHLLSIISIDTAEEMGVVITASTDCTVRLWTNRGLYVGTFGQRREWQLPLLRPNSRRPNVDIALLPQDLQSSSIETLEAITGAITTKWKVARNRMRAVQTYVQSDTISSGVKHHRDDKALLLKDILGRCYRRRTRQRCHREKHHLRTREVGNYAIYDSLSCPEIVEPPQIPSPLTRVQTITEAKASNNHRHGHQHQQQHGGRGGGGAEHRTGHAHHTEASLLQGVWPSTPQRKLTIS